MNKRCCCCLSPRNLTLEKHKKNEKKSFLDNFILLQVFSFHFVFFFLVTFFLFVKVQWIVVWIWIFWRWRGLEGFVIWGVLVICNIDVKCFGNTLRNHIIISTFLFLFVIFMFLLSVFLWFFYISCKHINSLNLGICTTKVTTRKLYSLNISKNEERKH